MSGRLACVTKFGCARFNALLACLALLMQINLLALVEVVVSACDCGKAAEEDEGAVSASATGLGNVVR